MPAIEIPTSLKDLLKEARKIIKSSNGKKLVILTKDSIYLWDIKRRKKETTLLLDKETNGECIALRISNDNHLLVACSMSSDLMDQSISMYNIKSSIDGTKPLTCIQKIKKKEDEYVSCVEIIPHTHLIAILGSNAQTDLSTIQFFNLRTNKYIRSFTVPKCYFIKFFDYATMITSNRGGNCIKLWDLKSKSEQPLHTIVTKDKIVATWSISDKQLMTQEGEFIKVYNSKLECVIFAHIGKYLMDSSVILNDSNLFEFHNLDNKNFISTHYYEDPGLLQLNLWRLSNNRFEMLPSKGFPMTIKLKMDRYADKPITFIPFQKNEGVWLCVIKDENGETITIPVDNEELVPAQDEDSNFNKVRTTSLKI